MLYAGDTCCNDGSGSCPADTPVCGPNSKICCPANNYVCGTACLPKGKICCNNGNKYCDEGFKCVGGDKCQKGSAGGLQAKMASVTALAAAVVMLLSML